MAPSPQRSWLGGPLVVVSCVAIQCAAALSFTMFNQLGVAAVAGLRQLISAFLMVVIIRPRLGGRSPREWRLLALYGLAMDVMTVTAYHAVDRLSLGVAATLIYLGPLAIAVAAIRTWRELLSPLAALIGVVLVARPHGSFHVVGLAAGLASAGALAAYTLASQHAGRIGTGMDSLSLAIGFAALFLLPVSAPAMAHVDTSAAGRLMVCGLAVTGSFVCDFSALRVSSARVVATLFALDPVIGALLGFLLLAQEPTVGVAVGILLIVGAGVIVTLNSSRPAIGHER